MLAAELVGSEHFLAVDGRRPLAFELGDRGAGQLRRDTREHGLATVGCRAGALDLDGGAAAVADRRSTGQPLVVDLVTGIVELLASLEGSEVAHGELGGVVEDLVAVLVGTGGEADHRGDRSDGQQGAGPGHAGLSICDAEPMASDSYPVALYLQDAHPIREGIEYVRQAEAAGFDAVWQADSRLVRDAVVPMAAFAAATERIKVGSGVVDIWTRNTARLASTFSTLDDLAPGRILCGLGAWWDPLATKVGIERGRPLTVMREVVAAMRGLLGNQQVTLDGTRVRLDGVELDYVYQPRRPKDVPIYIGATGMQMMELAGEIADGVVLNYLVDPAYNVQAMEALTRGAAKAGRSVDDVDRPQLVVCSVDADRHAALDAARLMVTQYLGQQPHIMKASGVPQELLDEIATVLTWPATHEQVDTASRLVPDDVVQRCTASGSPDEVVAKVDEYVANGCTCPILYPLGPDVGLMIETFARR